LHCFRESTILVHGKEWQKPYGNLPKLYPKWFNPVLLELTDRFENFDSVSLTKSGDLLAIHTPGHSAGHISILLKTDNANILFAGDVCYSSNQIFEDKIPGANQSYAKTKETYRKIRALSEKKELIILPSHDANVAKKL
jgi:glyoxylase-like metal-dependent hydrolase (beta-lactamase superfamily II)